MTTVSPLGNKIAVRAVPQREVSKILHVVQGAEVYREAEVLAIGPEVRDVEVGSTVYGNLGTALEFDGVYVIPEAAILATIKPA
jgi:co-chaperonin GroES (HSP10)